MKIDKAFAAIAGLALAPVSLASIIDFEGLATGSNSIYTYGNVVSTDGFLFRSLGHSGATDALASWGTGASAGYTGSVALFMYYTSDTLRMARADEGAFSVSSIGLAHIYLNAGAFDVTFTGRREDNSTVVETLHVGSPTAMADYAFSGMTNIVSLEWSQDTNYGHQFDNLNVSGPVPEPFTLGLAGLGLAAAVRRRVRK